MHSWLRRRLSFANLMATAAMFLALGGTATAVVTALPANSVGTKQLKDKAVTSAKVHPGTLTTEYIARDGAANGTTMYGPVSGSGNGDANILNVLQGTPAVTMTASNLSVSAGVGNVTVTLTVGQSDTALTCTTGTNGICTDTTDKVSIPPSSAVAYKVENNSGQGVAALTGMQTKLK